MDIGATDRFVQRRGTPAVLRRTYARNALKHDVSLKVVMTSYKPTDLVGATVVQGDMKGVISTSEIIRKRWPGPPKAGDWLIFGDKAMRVEGCDAIDYGGVVVRYNLQVRGES